MLYNIKGMHYDRVSDELWITTFSEGLVRIDISDNTLEEISLGEPIQNIINVFLVDAAGADAAHFGDGLSENIGTIPNLGMTKRLLPT